jgi:DNA repair exonuclease SbcCD ATPase subunit
MDIELFLTRDLDHSRDRSSEQNPDFGQWSVLVSELRQLVHNLSETGRSFDGARETFDHLRAQQNDLVAGFDPILLDHCAHLVLGSGRLRDLQQDVNLTKDTIAEVEIYAKRVEEALKATKGQEERAKEFVASLQKDLTAHRKHSEEFQSYAGDLESRLEENEALIRALKEEHGHQEDRFAQRKQAIHEGVIYAKSLESEIEKHRIQKKEVKRHMQNLESEIEKHRVQEMEVKRHMQNLESEIEKHRVQEMEVKTHLQNLESQLEEHKTQQLESARHIQSLVSQLGEPGTRLPNLDAVPGPPAGGGIHGSQAPSDRDQDYD